MTMSRFWICRLLLCFIGVSTFVTIRSTSCFQPHTTVSSDLLRTIGRSSYTGSTATIRDTTTIHIGPHRRPGRTNRLVQKGTNDDKNNDLQPNRPYDDIFIDRQRRTVWTKTLVQLASVAVAVTALLGVTRPVYANNQRRSRTTGYPVQKTEAEWKEFLSPMQYYILREGGTEPPGYSILETEKRKGTFRCAGCGTPLFQSGDKFTSGTGWPSFARAIVPGVEIESINPLLQLTGAGAELRCRTCGGHLGDVFQDGYLFIGTAAAVTGQRYCIDGAALLFDPNDDSRGSGDEMSVVSESSVRGDVPAVKPKPALSTWFDPPDIRSRD